MEAVLPIPQPDATSERQQSTIEFAYTDLDGAIEVANGVHRGGGPSCEYEQLAAELHSEAKGGHFRLRVSGARLFGLARSASARQPGSRNEGPGTRLHPSHRRSPSRARRQ